MRKWIALYKWVIHLDVRWGNWGVGVLTFIDEEHYRLSIRCGPCDLSVYKWRDGEG